MFYDSVRELIKYANDTGILPKEENIYTVNQILALFKEDAFEGEVFEGDGSYAVSYTHLTLPTILLV